MPPRKKKFQNTNYVDIFLYARDGMSTNAIARAIGVSQPAFLEWLERDPAVQDAFDRGRAHSQKETYPEVVFNHLPPDLQELWLQIEALGEENSGITMVDNLLTLKGTQARQRLFLYSLAHGGFNFSQSLRKLAIGRKTYEQWCASDPDFLEMVHELEWHKDNFIENALMWRIAAGDTPAIIHASKTKLRNRGYGEKIQVEHTGQIEHKHSIDVMALDLPLETRKSILAAVRQHNQEKAKALPTTAVAVGE